MNTRQDFAPWSINSTWSFVCQYKMSLQDDVLRELLKYEFLLNHNASQAARNVCTAYRPDTVKVRTAQRWYSRFRNEETEVEDRPRSGRPPVFWWRLFVFPTRVRAAFDYTRDCCYSWLYTWHCWIPFTQTGQSSETGNMVLHVLTESNMRQRLTVCSSILTRHNQEPFLDRIVTDDEKWVLYINDLRKPQWVDKNQKPKSTPKLSIHPKKIMLCVWWNSSDIIHYELLPTNTTVTAALYQDQLGRVATKLAIQRPSLVNRKRVILLHDNARPHVAKMTHEKIVELGWEVLPHPPY